MSLTKELIEHEKQQLQIGHVREIHLHKEGSFLRAYDWSAFLCCRLLHEFKVSKRAFKGIDELVAYIGFPETSLPKWTPEGAQQDVVDEKHLVLRLPEQMLTELPEVLAVAYKEWKEAIPLAETQTGQRKRVGGRDTMTDENLPDGSPATLTTIMQRVLAWPLESKSPIETMTFLADIKQRLASLV